MKFSAFFCALTLLSQLSLAAPKVVVTIKPLHSLVAQVSGEVFTPDLLMDGNSSPHDTQLKPSQLSLLRNAELLIYADDQVDGHLAVIDAKFAFTQSDNLLLLPIRGEHNHDHDHDHGSHEEGANDGHAWLNTKNAQAFLAAVAAQLSALDEQNAETYQQNAQAAIAELILLEQQIEQQLGQVKEQAFLVFHDGYQYFDQQFDLHWAGAISLNVGQSIHAKQLFKIKKELNEHNIRCVFAEPQFDASAITSLTKGSTSKVAYLDAIGSQFPASKQQYQQMMLALADSFYNCLK